MSNAWPSSIYATCTNNGWLFPSLVHGTDSNNKLHLVQASQEMIPRSGELARFGSMNQGWKKMKIVMFPPCVGGRRLTVNAALFFVALHCSTPGFLSLTSCSPFTMSPTGTLCAIVRCRIVTGVMACGFKNICSVSHRPPVERSRREKSGQLTLRIVVRQVDSEQIVGFAQWQCQQWTVVDKDRVHTDSDCAAWPQCIANVCLSTK